MSEIITLIMTIALQMNFDPNMAVAVAMTESNLNPNAVGTIGEIGLFQLRPEFFAKTCTGVKKAYVVQKRDIITDSILEALYSSNKVMTRKKLKRFVCGMELFDAETNIRTAIKYLKATQNKFSEHGKFGFLAAYNLGHTKVKKISNLEKYVYSAKVASNYKKLVSGRSIASIQ